MTCEVTAWGGAFTDLHAPDTGRVVEGGVELPRPARVPQLPHIPHVHAVVVVDAGQPAAGGVIGHRHRVRVTSLWLVGEQLTEEGEEEKT